MDSPEQRWDFLLIDKKYSRDHFDCGNPVLDDYLKRYARQNHDGGIAKTFVAINRSSLSKIDGFYTVSASDIEFESLPELTRKNIPAYPIPAILIGKLAVDKSAQGQGLGRELIVDALLRSVKIAQEIGIFAVRVDAIDLKAKEFYLKYGFIPLQDKPLALFLPIKTIAREFVGSQ
jgi:GNAT superfamily N-acetyltransferase